MSISRRFRLDPLLLVMALLGVAAAGWVGVSFASTVRRAIGSRSWPTAIGSADYLQVTRLSWGSGAYRVRTYFAPSASYRYEVNGKVYRSRRVRFEDPAFDSEQAAHAYIEEHTGASAPCRRPTCPELTVYYDPRAPSISTLAPGTSWRRSLGTYGVPFAGSLIWCLGCLAAMRSRSH